MQQESQSDSFSGSPLHVNKTEDPDSICEKAERPSPVSVLEPFYVEDVIDHKRPVVHQGMTSYAPESSDSNPYSLIFQAHLDGTQNTISFFFFLILEVFGT